MYQVGVTESVRDERSIEEVDIGEDDHLSFESRESARDWIGEIADSTPSLGDLYLREPDSEADTTVDAFLVYREPSLCKSADDRPTSVQAGGFDLRSGTVCLDERTQELFTFAYPADGYVVCIEHGHTNCDPKGIQTYTLETFDERLRSHRFIPMDNA